MQITNIVKTNFLEEQETVVENEQVVLPKQIITLKVYLNKLSVENGFCPVNKLDNDFKEDYSGYEMAEYVTEEEISSELARAKEMEDLVGTPDMGRTALEAQLSAILTRMRKDETKIKDLGYKLNHARVVRRVWDYIKKYHK